MTTLFPTSRFLKMNPHAIYYMVFPGSTSRIHLEMRVQSLGWEDPLEEDMATHSSILAWRIPMDRGAWRATRVQHD